MRTLLSFMCMATSLLGCRPLAAQVGPYHILPDVPGYHNGSTVLVPAKPFTDWAGGRLAYEGPRIQIEIDDRSIDATVGSKTCRLNGVTIGLNAAPTVIEGILCFGARDLCGLLGFEMEYEGNLYTVLAEDGSELPCPFEEVALIPHIIVRKRPLEGRILVHECPPRVTQKVIADLENTKQFDLSDPTIPMHLGRFVEDWILQVKRMKSGYFLSAVPASLEDGWYEDRTVYFSNAWGLYGYRDGKWRFIIGGQDDPEVGALARAGVPIPLAKSLGLTPYREGSNRQ